MNVAHLFARSARVFGDRPALASGSDTLLDYGELVRRAAVIAGGLRATLKLAPGDRVALVMHNCPAYVEILLAGWWAGLCMVPVNARLHRREFEYILEHAGARVCFVTAEHAAGICPLEGEIGALERVVVIGGSAHEALLAGDPLAMAEAAPDDLAWLFYTSGTTGRPKGAMLTHQNLLAMTLAYLTDVDRIDPGDAIIHAAPMSHGSGLYILPHAARAACQVVPTSGGFEPAEVFSLLRYWRGAALFAAPTMVKRLAEAEGAARDAHPGLKTIVYGGGPMYGADLERAHAAFGHRLAQIYGQGESPMCITALDKAAHADVHHPRHRERLGSVGTAQMVVEVMVAGPDDRPLPPAEAGEVLVRGMSVMRGYWRDEAATRDALRNGWLHTGDIGSLDQDGFLTLHDRSKDLIISGGSNIYPREVEEVLLLHPTVREVAVVGRADPAWGEAVVAFVVSAPGIAPDPDALERHCLEHIARFKRPKEYRFVAALPKNNYGKVLKTELRLQLELDRTG
ncbi:MAG TPA: AMP-binding protein [Geminicoccaceae bacterium]